ncbi:MAG: glycosyltransferase [Hespellia sp.]|nr:glycosyltransferase [Hespellia sp.]
MRLSVIVPVYNVEQYLEECLNSLLSQTDPFDEILLINDGSTDSSGKICERYARQYPQVLLINQENAGLGEARNAGLRRVSGGYVIFVDSDDYVRAKTCEAIKKALAVREVDVLLYNADIQYDVAFTERKSAFCHMEELDGKYLHGMDYLEKALPARYTSSACVAAYRRSFLENGQIHFPKGIYFEDHLFSLQVMSNAKMVSGIPDALYVRRCREDSIMTGRMTEKKCRDLVTNQKLIWDYIAKYPGWTDRKELSRRVISFGIIHTFFELSQYEAICREEICGQEIRRKETCRKMKKDPEFIVGLKQELVELLFQMWFPLFREEQYDLGTSLAFLLILKGDSGKRATYQKIRSAENRVRTLLHKKLSELPLNRTGEKVGIYGLGKHTQVLLRLYRQEIGAIQSDLFYIVSTEEEKRKWGSGKTGKRGEKQKIKEEQDIKEKQKRRQQGEPPQKRIFLCEDIPEDTAYIILSSMGYQQEMYENLRQQEIDEEKIIRLYTDHTVCDLILAVWVMDYEAGSCLSV